MSPYDPKEIENLKRQEKARGVKSRRPPDPEKLQERQQRRKDIRDLLRMDDREGFLHALTEHYGLQPGSEPFVRAVRVWEQAQRGRSKP